MAIQKIEEVMRRFGSRPALLHLPALQAYFSSVEAESAMLFDEDDDEDYKPYDIEGSTAIINISGPLSNARWSWGGTTYGDIQERISTARADEDVKGLLYVFNTPGGDTDMAFETAALIKQVAAEKPSYAVAATMCYSAGYLLAAQCAKIFCVPVSGGLGSIGVYGMHVDMSEALKKAGYDITFVSAGDGKVDGNPYQPLSKAAKDTMQAEIDRLYGEFVMSVSAGRNMMPNAVIALGARCYEGAKAAIAAGLADEPGDMTDAWSLMEEDYDEGDYPLMNSGKRVASATNPNKEKSKMKEPNADAARTTPPPTAAEIQAMVDQARTEGFAEGGLIADMCALAGCPAKAADFIRQKKTAKDVSAELLAAKVAEDAKNPVNPSMVPGLKGQAVDLKNPEQAQGTAKPWTEIVAGLTGRKGTK